MVAAIVRASTPAVCSLGGHPSARPAPSALEPARGYEVVSLGLDIKRTSASAWERCGAASIPSDYPPLSSQPLWPPGGAGPGVAPGWWPQYIIPISGSNFTAGCGIFYSACATDRYGGKPRVYQDIRKFDGVPTSRLLLIPNGISQTNFSTPLTGPTERLQVSGLVIGIMSQEAERPCLPSISFAETEPGDR